MAGYTTKMLTVVFWGNKIISNVYFLVLVKYIFIFFYNKYMLFYFLKRKFQRQLRYIK